VADATCGVQSEWPKPDHDDRHVCALAPDHPHIRNHVCSCGVVFACSRATAGSPSPTPGPTREQVAEAIGAVLRRGHSQGPWLDGAMWEAADAVMALLSTPATVLWEGPIDDVSLPDRVTQLGAVPPGTRVRVIVAPDNQEI